MIFKTITLCNMFSYYGEIIFRLNEPLEGQNIILISGRNGHGKTSFINSIKLLFSGPSEDLRSGIPGSVRKLNSKQYLLGLKDLWVGVFNRKARKEGQNRFYVKIVWEEDSELVEAKREWVLSGDDCQQQLDIITDSSKLMIKGEDAQEFLNERLPPDYIPFFYFDSEQIHKMIDISQNNLQKHMERLLNIYQIETAREYISKAETDWKKAAMVEDEKARLLEKMNDLSGKKAAIARNNERRTFYLNEIVELEDEIEQVSRKLDRLRENSQIGDEKKLKKEQEQLKKEIDDLTQLIADDLTDDTPLFFNSTLIHQVSKYIKIILESDVGVQTDLIDSFVKTLPINLFDNPPYSNPSLTEHQILFYKKRLVQLLEAYKPVHDDHKTLFFIEKHRASKISDIISPYMNVEHRKKTLNERLKKLNNHKKRVVEIDHRLDDIPGLNQQKKEEFESAKKELAIKSELKGDKEREIKQIEDANRSIENELKKLERDILHQEKQVKLSGVAKNKLDLALQLKSFFKQYKDELKRDRREQIESKLNIFAKRLITSHHQVDHIKVDDDFSLHPLDKNKESIGINSLASGIRQLIATALLWALKDVSGKIVPLVIDTPLGRIDREHQENLLKHYYPSVGKQVIILPTDSELSEEKYNLLKPHICQEFMLKNADGESTEYSERPMY